MWGGNLNDERVESDDDESIDSSASEFYEEEGEGMAVSYGNYVRYGEEEEEHIDVREEKVEKRQRADSCVSTGSW